MKFAFTSVVVTGVCVCVCGLTPGPDISHLITGCFVRCIQSQLCLKYIRYKSCIPHLYTIFYSFIGKLCLRIDQLIWSCTIFMLCSKLHNNKMQTDKKGLFWNCVCKCCLFFMHFIIHCGFAIWRRYISVESSFMPVFYCFKVDW